MKIDILYITCGIYLAIAITYFGSLAYNDNTLSCLQTKSNKVICSDGNYYQLIELDIKERNK